MDENYLMLNGKRVDLTDEQIKKLGLKVEEKDYFTREYRKIYYYIGDYGTVKLQYDAETSEIDKRRYSIANYCTSEYLMQQRTLHETLNRLLWRFSMQNDGEKIDWYCVSDHCLTKYYIVYDHYHNKFLICDTELLQRQGVTYFYTKEIAQRALDEIVLPFMKEHPDFVW